MSLAIALIFLKSLCAGVSNSAGSAPSSPGAARRLERLSDNQTEERLSEKRLEEQQEEDHDQRAQPQSIDHQLFGTRVQASGEPLPIGQSNQLCCRLAVSLFLLVKVISFRHQVAG